MAMIGAVQAGTAVEQQPATLRAQSVGQVSAVPYIVASAKKYRPNDPTFPLVCLALASSEGGLMLPTPSGDNNTSHGPFQLHEGGALPKGRDAAWANSPEGIDYAVRQIASATKGTTGPAAVRAGVLKFERPAAPTPEIAKDLAYYRQEQAAGGPPGLFVNPSPLPNPGGALGTGSGVQAKYTPGMFDCGAGSSYFFGLVNAPPWGCYLMGALKLVGMGVLAGGLALAGFYLILPRSKARALAAAVPMGAALTRGAGAARSATAGAAAAPASGAAAPADPHKAAMQRARLRKARADARTSEHKARQAKADTGTTYSLSPNTEAALRRAQSAPRRGRPDRMAG